MKYVIKNVFGENTWMYVTAGAGKLKIFDTYEEAEKHAKAWCSSIYVIEKYIAN